MLSQTSELDITKALESSQYRTEVEDATFHPLSPHPSAARKSRIIGTIHLIPPEILGQIFVEWLEQRLRPTSVPGCMWSFPKFCCPKEIMSVCSRWFRIALTTPQLWAVGYHYVTAFDSPSQLEWFQTKSGRAGTSPLKVSYDAIESSDTAPAQAADANSRVWTEHIRPLLPRLVALRLHWVEDPAYFVDLVSARDLQDLSVLCSQLCEDSHPVERDKTTVLPKLRSLSLTQNAGTPMQVQCPSLVSFSSYSDIISSAFLKHLSESAPLLEEVTLTDISAPDDDIDIDINDDVVFPQMHNLRVESILETYLGCFDHCPRLNTLELHIYRSNVESITALPLENYPCLRSLIIIFDDGKEFSDEGSFWLSMWIASGKTITHLTFLLEASYISYPSSEPRRLLGKLRRACRGGGGCPNLQHLKIDGNFGPEFELAVWHLILERSAPLHIQEKYGYKNSRFLAYPVHQCALTLTGYARRGKAAMKSVDWEEFARVWGPNYPSPDDDFELSRWWGFESDSDSE